MAGRQAKPCIESLMELRKTFAEHPESEFGLLIRTERKVEMDLSPKVVAELQKLLQKIGGNRGSDD
jgi:hypothetical protein